MGFKKNNAVAGFSFVLVNKANGSAVTSGTINGYITKDGGVQASLANNPAHKGNGQWSINLTAGEMNADCVGLLFVHTDAVPVHFTIKTEPACMEKAAKVLVNKAVQNKLTCQIVYYDDDGQTAIVTHTPTDDDTTITRAAS
jgi:hypothetical protein